VRKLSFANATHVGRVRSENQDSFGKFPEGNTDLHHPGGQLFVIADGMGGQNAGREASAIAVNTLGQAYYAGASLSVIDNLGAAYVAANEAIYSKSTSGPEYRGMGTTCVTLVLTDGKAFIGNIGDSRVYKINHRGIRQLTQDHSKVAELVRRGIITAEEARHHPERSHLYRAMGPRPTIEVDYFDNMALGTSRSYLMCTDGLFNHVDDDEMRQIILNSSPERACKQLIQLALDRGGSDNVTIQVIRVEVSNSTSMSPIARGKERFRSFLKSKKR
jgi:serine/threonine protein phosphatase PrpC